jgi:hypothetical protein
VIGGRDGDERNRGRDDQHQVHPIEGGSPAVSRTCLGLSDGVFHDCLSLCLKDGNVGLPRRPLCDRARNVRMAATLKICVGVPGRADSRTSNDQNRGQGPARGKKRMLRDRLFWERSVCPAFRLSLALRLAETGKGAPCFSFILSVTTR